MSGLEIVQVVASVSELVRLSYHLFQFLRRLRRADENAAQSLKQIKHLHEVAYGVKLALERRQEQVAKGSSPQGEEQVWGYVETSIGRCHGILLDIRKAYTPFSVETRPNVFEKAARQIRFEVIRKEELLGHYAALSTQLQALQLNTQILNTFISIGATDRIDSSREEILDAIARLEKLHQKSSVQLAELLSRRDHTPSTLQRRDTMPSIGVVAPPGFSDANESQPEQDEDVGVMRGALSAAMDLISIYDPSGQSVIERLGEADPEDADSGLGSDEENEDDFGNLQDLAPITGRRSSERSIHPVQVKHINATSRRVLDGCIERYQLRVENDLSKDKIHTAEADLQQLLAYVQERKEKYDVDYDKVQMQELLAQIYKRQGKHREVFTVLQRLVPLEGSPEEHTLEHSRHYHMIAETYYELWTTEDKKLDLLEAQKYATTAFTIRERADADDHLLRETAKLLASIFEALDKPVEAEVYHDMFPEDIAAETPPQSPRVVGVEASPSLQTTDTLSTSNVELDVNRELVRAIKDRDIARVRRVLQSEDVELDYRYRTMSPLHYAFQKAQVNESMPLALLEKGFMIDVDDEDGRTVLHQAAARGDAQMIRLAIRRDAIKEAKDKSWLTPLLIAVKEGHKNRECAPVLEAIEALLDEGCDPKAKDRDGWTILHHAAHNSASFHTSPKSGAIAREILELLLHKLPQNAIEARDRSGCSPLLRVANAGDPITVGMLLDAGAIINTRNNAGRSALYLAMYQKPDIPKYANVIKLLADKGATVNEDEHTKEDFRKFKHLLLAPSSADSARMRRASEQSARRKSESKNSVHHAERASIGGSSSTGQEVLDSPVANMKKARKVAGLRILFGKP